MKRAIRQSAAVGAVFFVSAAVHATDVELNTSQVCYDTIGATITVTVDLRNAASAVVGGQFFFRYDSSVLQFVDAVPGDPPFTVEVYEQVPGDGGADTLDYAASAPSGDPGTMNDVTMAVLTFTALAESCESQGLPTFREHDPPTRLSNAVGDEVPTAFHDLIGVRIDTMQPQITCPDNATVEVGGSPDPGVTGAATGSDSCDPSPFLDYTDSTEPGVCPVINTITRSWTVTDACGYTASCDQLIVVEDSDSDGDGAADCADGCPSDPLKISPGLCGCGVPDTDSDLDTVPDCNDLCPGQDDRIDENADGIPDCTAFQPIPAASTWGLAVLALLLLVGSKVSLRCGRGRLGVGDHHARGPQVHATDVERSGAPCSRQEIVVRNALGDNVCGGLAVERRPPRTGPADPREQAVRRHRPVRLIRDRDSIYGERFRKRIERI